VRYYLGREHEGAHGADPHEAHRRITRDSHAQECESAHQSQDRIPPGEDAVVSAPVLRGSPGYRGFRRLADVGRRACWRRSGRARQALLDEGCRQYDGQEDHEENDREAGEPVGEPQPFREGLHGLVGDESSTTIYKENLPERPAMHFDNEPLERGHRAQSG